MKLKSLRLENFASHKSTVIDFEKNPIVCLIARIASGKSYLLCDSITFTLFGKTRKKRDATLIRYGEKSGYTSLKFVSDNGDNCQVVRKITKKDDSSSTSLEVFKNNHNISKKKKSDTQGLIEDLIGMNYEVFTNSVILLQNNRDSILNSDGASKKEFFIKFFNLNKWLEKQAIIKEKRRAMEEEIIRIDTKLNFHDGNIDQEIEDCKNEISQEIGGIGNIEIELTSCRQELDKLNKEEALQEKIRQQNIENENKKTELLKEIEQKDSSIIQKQKRLDEFSTILQKKDEIKKASGEYKTKKEKIDDFLSKEQQILAKTNKISSLKTKIYNTTYLKDSIKEAKEEIIKLEQEKGDTIKCHKCGTPVREFSDKIQKKIDDKQEKLDLLEVEIENKEEKNKELQGHIDLLNSELEKLKSLFCEEEYKKLKEEIKDSEELAKLQNDLEIAQRMKTSLESDINLLNDEKAKYEMKIKEIPEKKEEGTDCKKTEIGIKEKEINQLTTKQQAHSQSIAILKKNIEDFIKIKSQNKKYEELLIEKKEELTYLQKLESAFSKNGIPLYLMNLYLPILEDIINKKLLDVVDFYVKFETQKAKADGSGFIDSLDMIIKNKNSSKEDEYSGASGGQQCIIRLAFTLALSELLRQKAVIKNEFLALDEAIMGFEEETESLVIEMLSKEMGNLSQFWMISHNKDVQALFENKIHLEKRNDISFICNSLS